MANAYETPEMDVIALSGGDVICTSDNDGTSGFPLPGGGTHERWTGDDLF